MQPSSGMLWLLRAAAQRAHGRGEIIVFNQLNSLAVAHRGEPFLGASDLAGSSSGSSTLQVRQARAQQERGCMIKALATVVGVPFCCWRAAA